MTINETLEALIANLFEDIRMQVGNAVRGYWFHDDPICPGCGRLVDAGRQGRSPVVSLNTFIYRERGVLIGYRLCTQCAEEIMRAAQRRPGVQIARHGWIERTLIRAYEQHISATDA